jgi:hypothetical protein
MVKIGRTAFVLLFLVLLSFQLSGLSCLDEWTVQSQDDALSQHTTSDDDCPCHFTFVSSPSINVRWSSLVSRIAAQPPVTYAFESRVLLFRPPALT